MKFTLCADEEGSGWICAFLFQKDDGIITLYLLQEQMQSFSDYESDGKELNPWALQFNYEEQDRTKSVIFVDQQPDTGKPGVVLDSFTLWY